MDFFRTLFCKKREPEFDLEKTVGNYLLTLPRCTKNIVVVSPEYGDAHYACEVTVEVKDLLPWAEHHAEKSWFLDDEMQAALKALPLWLRGAESSSNSASYIPQFMHKVIEPYVPKFAEEGKTKIFCYECQASVADVQMEKFDQKDLGDWYWWTSVWKCPQGHQLYYEEHEMHVIRKKKTPNS